MKIKDYLNKPYEIRSKIELLREMAEDDIDNEIAYEKLIAKLSKKLEKVIKDERKLISKAVSTTEMRNIIVLRYIENYSFEKIAEVVHYSLRRVYQLHKKALCEVEKNIDEQIYNSFR